VGGYSAIIFDFFDAMLSGSVIALLTMVPQNYHFNVSLVMLNILSPDIR
jgi:hypothetical protein